MCCLDQHLWQRVAAEFDLSAGDGSFFQLDFLGPFYELFGGSFGYTADGTPTGYVYTYRVFDYDNTHRPGSGTPTVDSTVPKDMYSIKENGTWRDYFEYIFFLNDEIYGSSSRDKLNGYTGDDFIVGNEGNDKLKGRPRQRWVLLRGVRWDAT